MTIEDILDLCADAGLITVEIYDLNKEKIVWSGDGDEVPEQYLNEEVSSWDVPVEKYHITFNI